MPQAKECSFAVGDEGNLNPRGPRVARHSPRRHRYRRVTLRRLVGRPYAPDMTLQRMDNVLIVVDDLAAAKAFFTELGMELEAETTVEGDWVGSVIGLNDVRADIAMMRTPDGHSRVELTKFHTPPAVRAEPAIAPTPVLSLRPSRPSCRPGRPDR